MRVMVFFDLPTISTSDHREYARFHKYLVKSGFIMMQESVYCKLALNTTASDAIVGNVRKNKPLAGLVQVLTVTEKQFSKIEYILGENTSEVLDSDERLVIL
ncbi:MAG: CRISPR-associated endonuclease Cas2 [Lachnospiraceae bacterium]